MEHTTCDISTHGDMNLVADVRCYIAKQIKEIWISKNQLPYLLTMIEWVTKVLVVVTQKKKEDMIEDTEK